MFFLTLHKWRTKKSTISYYRNKQSAVSFFSELSEDNFTNITINFFFGFDITYYIIVLLDNNNKRVNMRISNNLKTNKFV